ncbi:MAG: hypothetical protein JRM72_01305 [Nitrososphaerota archaeon]|nr:hypothetical protein [Nitrososphaerota archaeon]
MDIEDEPMDIEDDIAMYRDIQRSLKAVNDGLKDLASRYNLDKETTAFLREVNYKAIRIIDGILWDAGVIN